MPDFPDMSGAQSPVSSRRVFSAGGLLSVDKAAVSSAVLKDGGSVFVRVLGNTAEGRLLVSFAGRRFEASSSAALKPGMEFGARIRLNGNTVELVPFSGAADIRDAPFLSDAFFSRIGLPPDAVSRRILQLFQQLGVKVDVKSAAKARRIASLFPGREDEAAEAAALLLEKGLDADAASVAAVLSYTEGRPGAYTPDGDAPDGGAALRAGEAGSLLSSLYENGEDCLSRPAGFLTLFNHAGSGERRWILLPYETDAFSQRVHGSVRVLLDINLKRAEKIYITAFYRVIKWIFVLYLNQIACPKMPAAGTDGHNQGRVEFCCVPQPDDARKRKYESLFSSLLPDGAVYVPELENSGLFSADVPVYAVDAEA